MYKNLLWNLVKLIAVFSFLAACGGTSSCPLTVSTGPSGAAAASTASCEKTQAQRDCEDKYKEWKGDQAPGTGGGIFRIDSALTDVLKAAYDYLANHDNNCRQFGYSTTFGQDSRGVFYHPPK